MSKDNSRSSIEYRKRANEQRRCTTRGCSNSRFAFNSTCGPCTSRKAKLGSASSRPLSRAEYANEWSSVKRFCHKFRAHPRIVEGTAAIGRWLSDAQLGRAVPGRDAVAKLADKGAQPETVLIEILSVALHASIRDNPATRAPFLYANAMTKGIRGLPRGPQATSYHGKPPAGYHYYSTKDRKAMQKEITRLLGSTIVQMIDYFRRAEEIRNAEIAAKEKEGPRPFISLCSACQYNSRKAAEKRRAKAADPEKTREQRKRWAETSKNRKKEKGETNGSTTQE